MHRLRLCLPVFLAALSLPAAASAWTRELVADADLVERSEVVALAHLKPGTVEYVPHAAGGRPGVECRATLVITEILKGRCDKQEIPVVFHYGLTPVVGGHVKREGLEVNLRHPGEDYPKDIIEILDTGDSGVSFEPLVKDARDDNLWFLRHSNGPFGEGPVAADFGIVEPDDLQPGALKPYYAALLAKDADKAMVDLAAAAGEVGELARLHISIQDVRRIARLSDATARAQKLAPHYARAARWWALVGRPRHQGQVLFFAARHALKACGDAAGPPLRTLFDDADHPSDRSDIIKLWGEIRWGGAVEILTDLLRRSDRYWAGQELAPDWWRKSSGPTALVNCWDVLFETENAVYALADIGDPRGRETIRLTLKRWRAIDVPSPEHGGPPDIAGACEYALRTLGEQRPPGQVRNAASGPDIGVASETDTPRRGTSLALLWGLAAALAGLSVVGL